MRGPNHSVIGNATSPEQVSAQVLSEYLGGVAILTGRSNTPNAADIIRAMPPRPVYWDSSARAVAKLNLGEV